MNNNDVQVTIIEDNNKNNKKSGKKIILGILLILFISILIPIGFAYFTSNVSGNSASSTNVIKTINSLSLTLIDGDEVNGSNWIPGNYLEKTFTVKNNGNTAAEYAITLVDVVNTFANKNDLVYKLESSDGGYSMENPAKLISSDGAISELVSIGANATHTYKLTITFKYLELDQSDNMGKRFAGKVNIVDKSDLPSQSAISFATSSWSDIIDAYNAGNTTELNADMLAGTTRDVDLGTLGVHPVRIANLTPCSEVNLTSKTACGLVIEFADIISEHRMNPYPYTEIINVGGNRGGWESSDLRAYLNSTTYENESIDYSTSGVYDKFPSELKNLMIDTTVISGAGRTDKKNGITSFTTTDKLYLLSTIEVWNGYNSQDSASGSDITRQLDYYERKGVTVNNHEQVIKKYGDTDFDWWLRSGYTGSDSHLCGVTSGGILLYNLSDGISGVSPAFRLAN